MNSKLIHHQVKKCNLRIPHLINSAEAKRQRKPPGTELHFVESMRSLQCEEDDLCCLVYIPRQTAFSSGRYLKLWMKMADNLKYYLLVSATLLFLVQGQKQSTCEVAKIPTQRHFNLSEFMGEWHVISDFKIFPHQHQLDNVVDAFTNIRVYAALKDSHRVQLTTGRQGLCDQGLENFAIVREFCNCSGCKIKITGKCLWICSLCGGLLHGYDKNWWKNLGQGQFHFKVKIVQFDQKLLETCQGHKCNICTTATAVF